MALKRQQQMLATFSMASLTDIVFLLLVFFMVTSSFVFPTALEIDLPESTQQTAVKPSTRVFVDSIGGYWVAAPDADPVAVPSDSLIEYFAAIAPTDSLGAVAVYADAKVQYGKIVELLNLGAEHSVKMVLATRPTAPQAAAPTQVAASTEAAAPID